MASQIGFCAGWRELQSIVWSKSRSRSIILNWPTCKLTLHMPCTVPNEHINQLLQPYLIDEMYWSFCWLWRLGAVQPKTSCTMLLAVLAGFHIMSNAILTVSSICDAVIFASLETLPCAKWSGCPGSQFIASSETSRLYQCEKIVGLTSSAKV